MSTTLRRAQGRPEQRRGTTTSSTAARKLAVDDVPLADIAATVGTPWYMCSATAIRDAFTQLDSAFADYPHAIHYALKANSSLEIVRLLQGLGGSVDADSIGEVDIALRCGFDPGQIMFTGVGKSADELARAIALGLKRSMSSRLGNSIGSIASPSSSASSRGLPYASIPTSTRGVTRISPPD